MSAVMSAPAGVVTEVRVKLATSIAERAATRALRRAVFCDEQGIFREDDSDAIDAVALPIAALVQSVDADGKAGGDARVIGTVRIHESAAGIWFGSRLAVAREARRMHHVGAALIRLAVGTAHAHGCKSFFGHIQAQNVAMFEKLHWHTIHALEIHGRPHHLMQADLAYYPAILDGDTGLLLAREPA